MHHFEMFHLFFHFLMYVDFLFIGYCLYGWFSFLSFTPCWLLLEGVECCGMFEGARHFVLVLAAAVRAPWECVYSPLPRLVDHPSHSVPRSPSGASPLFLPTPRNIPLSPAPRRPKKKGKEKTSPSSFIFQTIPTKPSCCVPSNVNLSTTYSGQYSSLLIRLFYGSRWLPKW